MFKSFKKVALATLAVLTLGTTLVSCDKENSEFHENIGAVNGTKSGGTIGYGQLHNAILSNAIAHFDTTINFNNVIEVVNYASGINKTYIESLGFEKEKTNRLLSLCDSTRNCISLPDFYDSLFDGNYSLSNSISMLYTTQMIDEYDQEQLLNNASVIEKVYNKETANTDALKQIKKIVRNGQERTKSQVAEAIYDIAEASIDFWNEFGEEPFGGYPAYLPPQAVADIGGAIVGAGASAATQYVHNGSVNGWRVVEGAVITAASASLGAPAKVGKAVCQAAVKAGKFLSKLL